MYGKLRYKGKASISKDVSILVVWIVTPGIVQSRKSTVVTFTSTFKSEGPRPTNALKPR